MTTGKTYITVDANGKASTRYVTNGPYVQVTSKEPDNTFLTVFTGARGLQGVSGSPTLVGTGAPDDSLGLDGYYYIDTTNAPTNAMYGPKTGGSWTGTGPYYISNPDDIVDGINRRTFWPADNNGSPGTLTAPQSGSTGGLVIADIHANKPYYLDLAQGANQASILVVSTVSGNIDASSEVKFFPGETVESLPVSGPVGTYTFSTTERGRFVVWLEVTGSVFVVYVFRYSLDAKDVIELPEIEALDDDDVIAVVDNSDGLPKKIKSQNIKSIPLLGTIMMFAGTVAPDGWAFCDGALYDVATYSDLFDVLGTTYGGDGTNDFALPDFRGRMPMHEGTGAGLTARSLGATGGAEEHTLTVAQLPAHNHPILADEAASTATPGPTMYFGESADDFYVESESVELQPTGDTGGDQPVDHMNPFIVTNFIIAIKGIAP